MSPGGSEGAAGDKRPRDRNPRRIPGLILCWDISSSCCSAEDCLGFLGSSPAGVRGGEGEVLIPALIYGSARVSRSFRAPAALRPHSWEAIPPHSLFPDNLLTLRDPSAFLLTPSHGILGKTWERLALAPGFGFDLPLSAAVISRCYQPPIAVPCLAPGRDLPGPPVVFSAPHRGANGKIPWNPPVEGPGEAPSAAGAPRALTPGCSRPSTPRPARRAAAAAPGGISGASSRMDSPSGG